MIHAHKLNHIPRRRFVMLALAMLALLTALGASAMNASAQDPPQVTVEVLSGPTSYPDQIAAKFKVKLVGGIDTNCAPDNQRMCPPRQQGPTEIYKASDSTHVVVAKLSFDDGGVVPWHTHPGPVVVSVAKGALDITYASNCRAYTYEAGQGFIGPGADVVHMAKADGETVVYATFLGVPAGGKPTTLVDTDPGC